MTMPTVVVVASDLSESSEFVVIKAAHIAGLTGLGGQLLHVIEASVLDTVRHWTDGAQVVAKLRTQAAKGLQEQSARVANITGQSLVPQVLEGNVLDSVLEWAPEDALLVLGAKRRFVLRNMLIGNTARHALYRRLGPVLVIKTATQQDYQHVMVATDFSAHAVRAARRARELFPKSHLHVVHVSSDLFMNRMSYASVDEGLIREYQEKARHRAELDMKQFLRDAELDKNEVSTRIESGDPAMILPALVEKLGVDLVVTGKQGRTALGDRLLGSVSQHLLQNCAVDVLVECQSV